MKTTSFSSKCKSLKISEDSGRAERITAATVFLESTKIQFASSVTKAKSCLRTVESGVLAGPLARNR